MVGGIVVNKRTGYTLVSGHQRLSVMDELQKYNAETKDNDYHIRVDLIDVEEKEKKELLILSTTHQHKESGITIHSVSLSQTLTTRMQD